MNNKTGQIRKAVVLAAGNGSRLQHSAPKPLLKVLGVPLLARTLFTLERAGITDAYVVIGYQGDRVRQEIQKIKRFQIRIHWLCNEEWKRPNGFSVLAAENHLAEPFILTMTDHVFHHDVIADLQRTRLSDEIRLAVDYDVDNVLDLDDATKVRTDSGSIVEIGKELTEYDAIDTGVFAATPELFRALRKAQEEGKESLSAGVQVLAREGKAGVSDIEGRAWHDIDTKEDVKEATRKLLAGVRKDTDGPVARFINRPLSTAMSRLAVKTPITPNQISVMTLGVSLVAAALAAVGGYFEFLLAAALFQFASVLDGTDGEVAKLTFRTSVRGEWIDTACDNLSYLAFLVGLVVGAYRAPIPDFYWQAGVVGFVAAALSIGNLSMYLVRRKKSGSFLSVRYGYEDGNGFFRRVMRVLHYFGKRDMLAFLTFGLAVFGVLPLALPLFGFGATFLLFPATLKANLGSMRKIEPEPEVEPVALHTWVVQPATQEREASSRSVAG